MEVGLFAMHQALPGHLGTPNRAQILGKQARLATCKSRLGKKKRPFPLPPIPPSGISWENTLSHAIREGAEREKKMNGKCNAANHQGHHIVPAHALFLPRTYAPVVPVKLQCIESFSVR